MNTPFSWPDRYGDPNTYYEGDNAMADPICQTCGDPAEELDEYGECADCADEAWEDDEQ